MAHVTEAEIAFLAEPTESPLEVRINFGIFAGRQATPAEIDDLARTLLPLLDQVTIVSEQRHEITGDSEASISSVRVELGSVAQPLSRELADTLLNRCEQWAASCIAERHAEVSEL
jgi:hypothetical protein